MSSSDCYEHRSRRLYGNNWTCVDICAHESALKGGEIVRLPEFTLQTTLKGSEVPQ